jgi:hypothetical protein
MPRSSKIALACILAAMSSAPAARAAEAPPDTLIVLQRGACEQRCAVYRLVIFADGTVIYDGRYFVRRAGLLRGGVAPEALAKLVEELETGGFFQMASNYGDGDAQNCDSIDGDGPTATLTVSSHGQSKTVLHNHRCVGAAPDRLTELEDKVDRAAGAAKWIK